MPSCPSLGPALEQAAPSGDFASVLANANEALTAAADPAAAPAPSSASSGATLTPSSSLLGLTDDESTATGSDPSVTGSSVVADAEQYLGVPYQWGGTSPTTGFDCSGLVQHVYGDLGISLPRTSQEQVTVGTPVASVADAQPGDLVFFEPSASGPGHVGIYIGNGQMIDAPHTGTDVQIQSVGQPTAIRRILPEAGGATTADGASSAIPSALNVPADLVPLFTAASAQSGVPASLLAAVAKQESGFNAGAVSAAGAQGLMQLMPSTASGLGVNAFDPAQAIDGAAQLLSGYLQTVQRLRSPGPGGLQRRPGSRGPVRRRSPVCPDHRLCQQHSGHARRRFVSPLNSAVLTAVGADESLPAPKSAAGGDPDGDFGSTLSTVAAQTPAADAEATHHRAAASATDPSSTASATAGAVTAPRRSRRGPPHQSLRRRLRHGRLTLPPPRPRAITVSLAPRVRAGTEADPVPALVRSQAWFPAAGPRRRRWWRPTSALHRQRTRAPSPSLRCRPRRRSGPRPGRR